MCRRSYQCIVMHWHFRVGSDDFGTDRHNIGRHNINRSEYNGCNRCSNTVDLPGDVNASSRRNSQTNQDR